MFEDLIRELQEAEAKINEKIKEIESKKTEEDVYGTVDLKERMWTSADMIKGSVMLKEDLAGDPFYGYFPDVFKPENKRTKEDEYILKKYIYMKQLGDIM